MQEVVIVSAARTPFGMYMGSLADQRCQDLSASSMKEAVLRAGIESSQLDISIFSEAIQTSLPANVGRHGWLLGGLDENPAGFTMNALCAGALQTMISGFNKIASGEYQGILAGGVETHSQAPYYILHPRYSLGPNNLYFRDQKAEVQTNAQPWGIYGELTLADIADGIAGTYGLSRLAIDEYALASQEKARAGSKRGSLKGALTSVVKKGKKGDIVVDSDEGLKKEYSLDQLITMPAINEGGTASPGNLAPLADGSASIILMSASKAKSLGCRSMASLAGFGIAAGNPRTVERTAVKSIEKALNFAGVSLKEVDFIDIHEASAAFSIAVAHQLGVEAEGKINVDGGSLALGHAGAATGGAMVANMIYRLQNTGARAGLVNVAAYGGQAITVLIKSEV